jgi:uncharacterized protein
MRLLLAGTLVASLALLAIWSFQRRLIYFPAPHVPRPKDVGLSAAEAVAFTSSDGVRLAGWFLGTPRSTATVIVFNGNAGNRAYRAPLANALAAAGFSVLLFDYRGYGENSGSPSEAGLAADARAAQAYVAERPGVDSARIVYFGESLGSGVAVRLATERRPMALVLRSPFSSLPEVAQHHYGWLPVRWLLRDRFDSLSRIDSVNCPVLVIAGDSDTIVPTTQSVRLYEHARDPKRLLVIEHADHNDEVLLNGPQVLSAVRGFVDHWQPASQ